MTLFEAEAVRVLTKETDVVPTDSFKKSRMSLSSEQLAQELLPGQSVALLQELHILTREGGLNADSRRKLKQVAHLFQLLKPFLEKGMKEEGEKTLVDLGAGKSYLGFILYDLFFKNHESSRVLSIESRAELMERGKAIAAKVGFDRMEFLTSSIRGTANPETKESPETVTWTTALHACDAATDDAIDFALKKSSRFIALVPCCQAALAQDLKSGGANLEALAELWARPIQRREFASQLTNVLRCLRLEAAGYHVTVTELVGWEHSLKNELILAEKKGEPLPDRREKLARFLELFPISPHWKTRFLEIRSG